MKNFKFANFIIFIVFFIALILVYKISEEFFDEKINDKFVKFITKIEKKYAPDNVILISVDDKSTDKYPLSWSRDKYAKIFDYLDSAAVVIFNNLVIFPDTYNINSDIKFFNSLKNNKNLINTYILLNSNITEDVIPSDYYSLFDAKSNVIIKDERQNKTNYSYNGIIKMPKDFLDSVNYLASSVFPLDRDDYVRESMPIVMYNNNFYPSLALSAYAMYTGNNKFILTDNFLCSNDNCKSLKIPINYNKIKDNSGNKIETPITRINWYIPTERFYSHKTYSAVDVLESALNTENNETPKINKSEFNGKIVIIGINSPKSKNAKVYTTPISDNLAEIDIQAVMIDNMLSNSFKNVESKDYTSALTIIFCFFILRGFKNFKVNLIFTTILACLYFVYYSLIYFLGIYTSSIAPIITMYSAAVLKSFYTIITTDKTAEMIKHAMGKYISQDVMNKVLSNLDKLNLGGTRAVVTIFFVDIRNFTKISEELAPNEVTSILNEYFSTIEPVIAKYHGIVNKYIGDGLLAVFGEPVKTNDHALNAVLCGIEIIEKVSHLREKFIKENKPVINIGIGVNTGEVFAGNIGTEERLEYTVIGDNVNLASRIEAYNQILKTQFLISEYTYEYVKDKVDVVKLSAVNIKGKSKPIDIYEVLRLKK